MDSNSHPYQGDELFKHQNKCLEIWADDTTMKTIKNNLIGKNWWEFSLCGKSIHNQPLK